MSPSAEGHPKATIYYNESSNYTVGTSTSFSLGVVVSDTLSSTSST